MIENPFDITKAVHYTNEQLLQYWVNLPGDSGFEEMINPKSQMPMIIVGGKGSGKTHLLKYYSYELQKIRYQKEKDKTITQQISENGYLGLYTRAGNLNSKKFTGNVHTEEAWQAIFEYHFDLFISQISLRPFVDLIQEEKIDINENIICEKVISLFDKWPDDHIKPKTLLELFHSFSNFQKDIDYQVNRSSLLGEAIKDLKILVTGGKLILGIPKILKEEFSFLKDVQFSYLIDEFENFNLNQQKFINTLIREIEAPISIKIGTRPYGIKTFQTFSGDEFIRKGAEYEEVDIDQIFRNRFSDYSNFVKQICLRRIQDSSFGIKSIEELKNSFEIFDLKKLQTKLSSLKRLSHRVEFESVFPVGKESIRNEVLENLNYPSDYLLEKVNYLIYYRGWKKRKEKFDFLEYSRMVNRSLAYYLNKKDLRKNHHRKILDKFKNDLIDQLSVENNLPAVYWGLDNFIRMSAGIPRIVLQIMKYTFSWANYNEEKPFLPSSIISISSQKEGLNQATAWFIKDAQIPGRKGVSVNQCINRIGQYLQTLRYSNIPPECSISSFRLDKTILSPKYQEILDFLRQYSYLIQTTDRKDKNLERQDYTYQMLGILAPNWGLSLGKRGVLNLSPELISQIFTDDESGEKFKIFINEIDRRYNAPFNVSGKSSTDNQTKLL